MLLERHATSRETESSFRDRGRQRTPRDGPRAARSLISRQACGRLVVEAKRQDTHVRTRGRTAGQPMAKAGEPEGKRLCEAKLLRATTPSVYEE